MRRSVSGSFFERLLGGRITLRMTLVGCQLPSPVAMQYVVGRGQGDLASERLLKGCLHRPHHQNAAGLGALQKRGQQLCLALNGETLPSTSTACSRAALIKHFAIDEVVS